jgi:predicted esterase
MSITSDFVYLYQPPKEPSNRILVLLHGTGGDEASLVPLAGALDPNAGYLSIRGKVLENGAPRFFRRLAEGVFDFEDLHRRTAELDEFLTDKLVEMGWTADQLVAVGYSNGANIAGSLLLSGSRALKGAILLRAMVPFEPQESTDLAGVSVMISSGKFDPIVPTEQPAHLAHLLTERGAAVTLDWQDVDHRLGRSEISDAAAWLARLGS